jgi:hypothetical protein
MEVTHDFWALDVEDAAANCEIPGDDERLKFDQSASPEGQLAYSSNRTGHFEIWTHSPGQPPRRLTEFRSYAGNPSWSSDGVVFFDGDRGAGQQVFKIRARGADLTTLTDGQAPSRKPVWGPLPARKAAAAKPGLCSPSANTAVEARRAVPAASSKRPAPSKVAISWVSLDRQAFEPARNEQVAVRFQVSAAARTEVRFLDSDGAPVRLLTQPNAEAGERRFTWDGRDDDNEVVPPGVYAYTVVAATAAGETVTYDLRDQTGGEPVWLRDVTVDPVTGHARYSLPEASRVRLMVTQRDTGVPIQTLLDWAPRSPGPHEEPWDGWDASRTFKALGSEPLVPVHYAYALPRNIVLVRSDTGAAPRHTAARVVARPPSPRVTGESAPSNPRPLHLHARHPRSLCYNPRVALTWPDSVTRTAEGLPVLKGPTGLRIEPAGDQGAGFLAPLPRFSVFVFLDGVMVERTLSGYEPYHWRVDPTGLQPGEHVVTALLAWRDDHFGIAHARVRVERSEQVAEAATDQGRR